MLRRTCSSSQIWRKGKNKNRKKKKRNKSCLCIKAKSLQCYFKKGLTWHAKILSFLSFMSTFRARRLFSFFLLNTLLLVWSSQKQALQRRQECWPSRLHETRLNVSASKTWQLAWCSNWSSSQRKLWQKEQLKILPPIGLKNKTHKCKYNISLI